MVENQEKILDNRTEVNNSLFLVFTCTHQILRLHLKLVSKTIRGLFHGTMPNELKEKQVVRG